MYYRKRQYFRFLFHVRKSDLFAGLEFLEEVAYTYDQLVVASTLGNHLEGSNEKKNKKNLRATKGYFVPRTR